MNRQALKLYDSIYVDQPVSFRAVARRNLVRKLLTAGHFDEGLAELKASTAELAQVRSLLPDDDASHHFYHGEMMLLMRRWAEAGQYLDRSRTIVMASQDHSESWLLSINSMLVWALCQQGDAQLESAPPDAIDALLLEPLSMGGDTEARIRSARACMHWRRGRLENARTEIDLALDLVTDTGALLERSERMIARGQIHASMGDLSGARIQVDAAIELFSVHGVNDHPNVDAFRRLEQELTSPP